MQLTQGTDSKSWQNCTTVFYVACCSLIHQVRAFLADRDDVPAETYPCFSKLTRRMEPHPVMPMSTQQMFPTKCLSPFGCMPEANVLFGAVSWYSIRMLACIELPEACFHELPPIHEHDELLEMVFRSREDYAERLADSYQAIAESEIRAVLHRFYDDTYSQHLKRRWLQQALEIPAERTSPENIAEVFEVLVQEFLGAWGENSSANDRLSAHSLATCALYSKLVSLPKRQVQISSLGPMIRLLANFSKAIGKQYLPQECCGNYVEHLAETRMPAYWQRLRKSDATPVDDASDLMLAVSSPPVMCWLCGEGFMYNGALLEHCKQEHGDLAEYRKRLFWQAQKDGFKPLLPWVKRHILQSATFHLTYSVPGTFSLKWAHPDAYNVAVERAEKACVVCARKDWLENRFSVYLWRQADGSQSYTELRHVDSGNSRLLTSGQHLCFGNRDKIGKHLGTEHYHELMPLIPEEELYASSVLHPEETSISWLLHTRRVPLRCNSRQAPAGGVGEVQFRCAGIGDPDETAWICYDCAGCLCVEERLIKMPLYALANLLWIGREHPLLQGRSLGLRVLLSLGRACFRKMFLGKGRRDEQERGLSGNALGMFDPETWTKCFVEFWFGDGLPNSSHRPRKLTFEQLFPALQNRKE